MGVDATAPPKLDTKLDLDCQIPYHQFWSIFYFSSDVTNLNKFSLFFFAIFYENHELKRVSLDLNRLKLI